MTEAYPDNGLYPDSTRAATMARWQLGRATDSEVFRLIRDHPGISPYRIAKLLKFQQGRVDGSVSRLKRNDEVEFQYVLKEGRLTKEVYPKGFSPEPRKEIVLDLELMKSPEKWKEEAILYALDRTTMGISAEQIEEWDSASPIMEKVRIQKNENNLVIPVPEKLSEFCLWENSSYETSITGNQVLVVFKTRIPIEGGPDVMPREQFWHRQPKRITELNDFLAASLISTNLSILVGTLQAEPQLSKQVVKNTRGSALLVTNKENE